MAGLAVMCRRIPSATLGKKAHFCDRHHIARTTAALVLHLSTGTTFAGSYELSPANAGLSLLAQVSDRKRSGRQGAIRPMLGGWIGGIE